MAHPLNSSVCVLPRLEVLSRRVAQELIPLARSAIDSRGRFTLALAGGKTPESLYGILAHDFQDQIPWSGVHLFWGDERCVPPDHPDSNFGMASRVFVSKIRIPAKNIHRIPAEMMPPEKAAGTYEEILRQYFGPLGEEDSSFTFDLVLLGIGKDGHTASLFPGDRASKEDHRWVARVTAPENTKPRQRITLTLPILNRAQNVFFIVSGADKRDVVRSILNDPKEASKLYPAARVQPKGEIKWFLDEEAYGGIDPD